MSNLKQLAGAIDDALDLLHPVQEQNIAFAGNSQISPSLLEQCIALCQQPRESHEPTIRSIHHLSGTGGTLFAKCLASMPNTLLLNEVDPLSRLPFQSKSKPPFTPTDMVALYRQGDPTVTDDVLKSLFQTEVSFVLDAQVKIGRTLLIRDHAHSQFLFGESIPERPTVREMLAEKFKLRSIVTVRDPIDSFLSVSRSGWIKQIQPPSYDEYCRRYWAFLDSVGSIPMYRYEDLIESPGEIMQRICVSLDITFNEYFQDLFSLFSLSGDSGRKGAVIASRERMEMSDELAEQIERSASGRALREKLGY